jgi:peptide deformylase
MTVLPLIIAPDPTLKTKSSPVEKVDDSIRQLAADLFDTMYFEEGIGLAAVQVGVLKRVLVADVTWRSREEVGTEIGEQYVLINPEILEGTAQKRVYKEGCLSFPNQFADVTRPDAITVRYLNLNGETKEETFDGLLATCIQHEIDHLNGITFVDHISSVKRDMILRKLTKLKRAGAFDEHDHSTCGHDHSHDHDHQHEHVHGEHCNH